RWRIFSLPSSLHHSFFFFNVTAPTEIYTLSLHDALPICGKRHQSLIAASAVTKSSQRNQWKSVLTRQFGPQVSIVQLATDFHWRSEEHTSELQSLTNLVCRLLLEKKKIKAKMYIVLPQ